MSFSGVWRRALLLQSETLEERAISAIQSGLGVDPTPSLRLQNYLLLRFNMLGTLFGRYCTFVRVVMLTMHQTNVWNNFPPYAFAILWRRRLCRRY